MSMCVYCISVIDTMAEKPVVLYCEPFLGKSNAHLQVFSTRVFKRAS